MPRRRACAARRQCREPITPTCSNSTSPPSSRSLAGPKRPQDRVPLRDCQGRSTASTLATHGRRARAARIRRRPARRAAPPAARSFELVDGAVVIAAITSCTNTSNPDRDDRRRPAGAEGAPARPDAQALGQDQPGAGLAGGHRLPDARPACWPTSKRSASTSSATAARPASATPARCARDLGRREGRRRRRRLGALRQPQLRGPRASGSAR